MAKKKSTKVEALKHKEAKRKNIPTAELEDVMQEDIKTPIQVAYERRDKECDPQLVWLGKEQQDSTPFSVSAPPLYIQEKVQPKAIIEDLRNDTKSRGDGVEPDELGLFNDFNGLPNIEAVTEFYQHDQNWSNRMICGDSMSVMASLSKREGLEGKVQCIYFDPPYGIKFNSNFQWSTTSTNVKDGVKEHFTKEPEQVKAFRDTWSNGIHTYLSYLRDRLIVARDLLSESGSIFVQIGDENVHRVRMLMDEVFGENNFCCLIQVQKTGSQVANLLGGTVDFLLWYAKSKEQVKYRQLYNQRIAGHFSSDRYDQIELPNGIERRLSKDELSRIVKIPKGKVFQHTSLLAPGLSSHDQTFSFEGRKFTPGTNGNWKTTLPGMSTLSKAGRVCIGKSTIRYKRFLEDFSVLAINDRWESMQIGTGLIYVVQTATKPVERCILMTTDPGDLVLDPTCGSGTTAYVAEQWGRRWITIDTSRVALALARSRLMGARYPYYILKDTPQGQEKEAEISQSPKKTSPTSANIRHGFVYNRVPHITLKSIAHNAEIDVIWEQAQPVVDKALKDLNNALENSNQSFQVEKGARAGKTIDFNKNKTDKLPSGEDIPHNRLLEWEVPRTALQAWNKGAKLALEQFWKALIQRQKAIDESIAAKSEFEYLYDKPFENNSKIRVAGPFTVESLSPHRNLAFDQNDELIDEKKSASKDPDIAKTRKPPIIDFDNTILEQLERVGVQQANKEDRIDFLSITKGNGEDGFICAKATFLEGKKEKTAAIFIGPEFGTVAKQDLVIAAREAANINCDILIACAFNYDALSSDFDKIGRIPILRARMNPDLHMGEELKGSGNLFVVFGEPDIEIKHLGTKTSDKQLIQVEVLGVDVFKPQTGAVVSDSTDNIALWMIDTDYNHESFFVRHAYFLGANDPYKSLKTTLRSEIDRQAWESLNSAVSRPFPKPKSGYIAVKVINHLGDEVMKVFDVRKVNKNRN